MNANQFIRHLKKHNVTVTFRRGKGGHARAEKRGIIQHVPNHGSRKQLGTGITHKICKVLGIPKP